MYSSSPLQNDQNRFKSSVIIVLRIICIAVFAGRAWQHLFWDAPFRTVLWDEALLKFIVESIGDMSWYDYVTSEVVDQRIQWIIKLTGVFYALLAILSAYIKPSMENLGRLLPVGSTFLLVLALLYCKEKFFHIGQFFEYTAQFMTPTLLYLVLFSKIDNRQFILLTKGAIALTFICHGLYAINYYPRPGNFVDMVINILHIGEPAAHTLLAVAGMLDFIIAIALFIPICANTALVYAFIWGLLTSLARIWANFQPEFALQTLNQWGFESIYRLPHAGLPLALLMMKGYWIKGLGRMRITLPRSRQKQVS